jgi:uncharacterized protein with HEPN domain/predicted RNase H-like HicB family nuclease
MIAARKEGRTMKIPAGWKEHADFRAKSVYDRAKLLAASGKQNRLDMSPAHVLELIERYPTLYREARTVPTSRACRFAIDGFCIGDGWHALVDRLSKKLSADPSLHAWQIKEKFGSLRVHLCDQDTPSDPRLRKAKNAALDRAIRESMRTCEICGRPGRLTRRRGWVSVRCRPCLKADDAEEKIMKSKNKSRGGGLSFARLRLPRKSVAVWFNDILVGSLSLPQCAEGMDFAAFRASRPHQAAALRHIREITEAASRQPADVKRQHRAVDWKALIQLKERKTRMTAREIWKFIREGVPALLEELADDEGLMVARKRLRDRDRLLSITAINRLLREGRRRSRRKAARAAAEARADVRDARIAERRIAELDAGRVRAISSEEMRERLGLGPRGDKPQTPYSHRYDFTFWLEDEIWSAKAPSVRGVYGVGPTAEEAKGDLVEALKAMSEHLEDMGESRKAAVCGRLVKAWKTRTR